ncbi:MAG: ABC transporter ATP-binding protein, partial [Coriobacteriales bacterium]|nr:ABC transporter ATP-binding protein [Coriobacteriales bacterium]
MRVHTHKYSTKYSAHTRIQREDANSCVKVQSISFAYDKNQAVLNQLSFSLPSKGITVLLGPNGCGKTTLLNCIAGILKPQSGTIHINDCNCATMNPRQYSLHLSYLTQIQNVSHDFKVLDYVVLGCAPRLPFASQPKQSHYEQAQAILEEMGIQHLTHKACNQISGGELQLAQIARTLMQETNIILMDEPTNHLDYGNQIRVLKLISELANKGYSILMTSHMPDHAIYLNANVAYFNRDGNFFCGNANEALTRQTLSDLYAEEIDLFWVDKYERSVCIPSGVCSCNN